MAYEKQLNVWKKLLFPLIDVILFKEPFIKVLFF